MHAEMRASTTSLPPVGGATGPSVGTTAADATKLRGIKAQHARAASRRQQEAPQRQAFLSGLLNEDLQGLSKWHGKRPHHEQKRFLRSVDMLYKAFSDGAQPKQRQAPAAPTRQQLHAQAAQQQAAFEARDAYMGQMAEEDPLNAPLGYSPRGAPTMSHSASAPSGVTAPIDVFEQRKRAAYNGGGGDEDPSTLDRWLEGGSVSTATTGTTANSRRTTFSQMTKTTSAASSICSEPGTMHQMQFRHHKRGFALNAGGKVAYDPQKSVGLPTNGFPDQERLVTTFKEQFGSKPFGGGKVSEKMYGSVIRSNQHPFIANFLETAPPEQRDKFAGMVRSLEYLRRADDLQTKTQMSLDMDLVENQRLFKPARAKPWFDPSQSNISRVPLGTLSAFGEKKVVNEEVPMPPLRPMAMAPPSPSVSGLGSLPLSRLSTAMDSVQAQCDRRPPFAVPQSIPEQLFLSP